MGKISSNSHTRPRNQQHGSANDRVLHKLNSASRQFRRPSPKVDFTRHIRATQKPSLFKTICTRLIKLYNPSERPQIAASKAHVPTLPTKPEAISRYLSQKQLLIERCQDYLPEGMGKDLKSEFMFSQPLRSTGLQGGKFSFLCRDLESEPRLKQLEPLVTIQHRILDNKEQERLTLGHQLGQQMALEENAATSEHETFQTFFSQVSNMCASAIQVPGHIAESFQLHMNAIFHMRYLEAKTWLGFNTENNLADTLVKSGPLGIKIAQVLALSSEVPVSLRNTLKPTLENNPPIPFSDIQKAVTSALNHHNENWDSTFTHFDPTPIKTGSVAQVHKATLTSGQIVAVKVVRPHLIDDIKKHQHPLSQLLSKVIGQLSPDKKEPLIRQLKAKISSITTEANLEIETRYAAYFQQAVDNLGLSNEVMIPKVIHELSNRDVLVMEFIEGNSIAELMQSDRPAARGLTLKLLDIWLEIACSTGLVHGDIHPGNGIHCNDKLCLIDFGDAFILPDTLRNLLDDTQLAKQFLLIFKYDTLGSTYKETLSQIQQFAEALFLKADQQPLTSEELTNISTHILLRLTHSEAQWFWDEWSEKVPVRDEFSWQQLFNELMAKYEFSLRPEVVALNKCLGNLINCFNDLKRKDDVDLLEGEHPELSHRTNNLLKLFAQLDTEPASINIPQARLFKDKGSTDKAEEPDDLFYDCR